MQYHDQDNHPELCECTEQENKAQAYDSTSQGWMGVDPLQVYSLTLEAILQAQQQLLSLDPDSSVFVAQSATGRIPATCPPGFQGRFTVRRGDTMFLIAQRFGVTLQALISANPHIPNPNQIFPGDVLCVPTVEPGRIPVTCPPGFQGRFTVRRGDTMFLIAQRFGVTLQALISANPHIPNPNQIFPGDVLCVPQHTMTMMTTEE